MPSQPPKRQYPSHADYDIAVQNIGRFVFDPVLKTGIPAKRKDGGLLSYPGGFAKAYQVKCNRKTYALRVWLHDIGDAARHYSEVAKFFKANPLPCFVGDFHFLREGILVNGQRFPLLRMEWVRGSTLGDFITQNLRDSALLSRAAAAFLEMVRALHRNGIAHGDLQAENMIVCQSGGSVCFKLIDYDTLVVPALVGRPISSPGLQSYQHPNRGESRTATSHDDYFAELVIYLTLLAVSKEPALWNDFPPRDRRGLKREKELLFFPDDFSAGQPTAIFHRLHRIGGAVKWLAVALWNFTRTPGIHLLRPLEEIVALADAALTTPPAAVMGQKSNFEQALEKAKRGGQPAARTPPKHWLDDTEFRRQSRSAKPKIRPASTARGATSHAPASAVGESFASRMKCLGPTRRPVSNPGSAPVLLPQKPPVQQAPARTVWASPRRASMRGAWFAAAAGVALLGWLALRSPDSAAPLPSAPIVNAGGLPQIMAGMLSTVKLPGNVELRFAYCPPGSFTMGSPRNETGRGKDEDPVLVRLTHGYWLGQYEVTQAQWVAVMGSNPSRFIGENLPVERVSWLEVQLFINKLNQTAPPLPGWKYALPTEAQWEYACRAGTEGQYAGSGKLDEMGWYDGNSGSETHPVGTKRANAWGLHDMHGNVWEWCADSYAEKLPGGTDPVDTSNGPYRLRRGGSWSSQRQECRSAIRYLNSPALRFINLGFRLAAVSSADPVVTTALPLDESSSLVTVPFTAGGFEQSTVGALSSVKLSGAVEMKFAYCPPGSFTMGSSHSENGRGNDEDPVQVQITKGFWLGQHEVTQAQWTVVMGSNQSHFKGDDLPVEQVSWNDAQDFISKLSQSAPLPAGWKYALPTEAQWEYACRAGTEGPYAGSGSMDEMGWYDGNSGGKTHAVGTKRANAWGLHDMHGNVWEWCTDWYALNLTGGPNPVGAATGAFRVIRSGAWQFSARYCRAANREAVTPKSRESYIGLRLAAVSSVDSVVTAPSSIPAASSHFSSVADGLEQSIAGALSSVKLSGALDMKFAYCPPGRFMMGSPLTEVGRGEDEGQVSVKITQGFWLGQYEVTQAQWEAVMGSNPSRFKGDSLPVESVSWYDTQAFIGKLNQTAPLPQGWEYALPTEAQWEYACRAGTKGPYAGSGNMDEMGWHEGNSGGKTHAVGTKRANAWGLHDMHGNVWEWCADWYREKLPARTDPDSAANGSYRVRRGGSWNLYAQYCRAAARFWYSPGNRDFNLGFRVAAVPVVAK